MAPLANLVGVQTGFVAWLHRLDPASWDNRLNISTFAADHVQTYPFRMGAWTPAAPSVRPFRCTPTTPSFSRGWNWGHLARPWRGAPFFCWLA